MPCSEDSLYRHGDSAGSTKVSLRLVRLIPECLKHQLPPPKQLTATSCAPILLQWNGRISFEGFGPR